MRKILYGALAALWLCAVVCAGVQTPAKTAPTAHKTAVAHKTVATHKKAVPRKTAVRTASASHRSTGTASRTSAASRTKTAVSRKSARKPVTRATWRNRQMAPTPERYKEIQDALVAKGYLSPADANGAWGQSSTDALKKFQADQNIDGGGKLNSLSLIALGLGPKHDTASVPKPADGHPQESR